jgi:hypothetical protein
MVTVNSFGSLPLCFGLLFNFFRCTFAFAVFILRGMTAASPYGRKVKRGMLYNKKIQHKLLIISRSVWQELVPAEGIYKYINCSYQTGKYIVL